MVKVHGSLVDLRQLAVAPALPLSLPLIHPRHCQCSFPAFVSIPGDAEQRTLEVDIPR